MWEIKLVKISAWKVERGSAAILTPRVCFSVSQNMAIADGLLVYDRENINREIQFEGNWFLYSFSGYLILVELFNKLWAERLAEYIPIPISTVLCSRSIVKKDLFLLSCIVHFSKTFVRVSENLQNSNGENSVKRTKTTTTTLVRAVGCVHLGKHPRL